MAGKMTYSCTCGNRLEMRFETSNVAAVEVKDLRCARCEGFPRMHQTQIVPADERQLVYPTAALPPDVKLS